MRRRGDREREDADAREQAEVRREALLAELKAREAAGRATETPEEVEEPAPSQPGPAEEPEAPNSELGDEPAPDEVEPAEAE